MAWEEDNDWSRSVTAVVLKDGKVLLARHTYGPGKGLLIIPGGYMKHDEVPWETVKREMLEETGIVIEPKEIIGIRMDPGNWYVAFRGEYISGTPRSDGDENSEVIWLDVKEALQHEDVPDLTKKLIEAALASKGLQEVPFRHRKTDKPLVLYALKAEESEEK